MIFLEQALSSNILFRNYNLIFLQICHLSITLKSVVPLFLFLAGFLLANLKPRLPAHRNQSIDLARESTDCFLFDGCFSLESASKQ